MQHLTLARKFVCFAGCATQLLRLSGVRSQSFPVLLKVAIAVQGSQIQDGLGSGIRPAHPGLLQSWLNDVAGCRFHLTRANG
jgi:hypothetical protein